MRPLGPRMLIIATRVTAPAVGTSTELIATMAIGTGL